jgi:tRNA-dihydrouridine synthase A
MINQGFAFAVAPMMDWTDRYCRVFHRALSKRALLYTEMVVSDAVIHGELEYLLGFDDVEHPVALQIGGSDPVKLAKASKIGERRGYDEININIGCPSDRVQSGSFGACLMAEPELVGDCFKAMQSAVDIPVTVKCRLGIDDQEIEKTLPAFIETVARAGCTHFIIHARKAWLQGLSPKENRDVPPLNYDLVRKMKQDFPELEIVLNGGLTDLDAALSESETLDGVMFGRAAYHNPWLLHEVDHKVFGEGAPVLTRADVARSMIEAAREMEGRGLRTRALTRHMNGLFHQTPGARLWRRTLSEGAASGAAGSEGIARALGALEERRASVRDTA